MKQQKIRPSWRQRTASFMVMVLMAGCLFSDMPSVHAAGEGAPETAERVCAPEEYSVEHHVTAEWEGGYKAEIRITDRSGEPMEGWSLSFCCESAITEVWDGVLTADGDGYQISGTEYNSVIENGESVTVGYTAAGTAEGITDVVLRCEGTGETDSREPSDNEGAGEDMQQQASPEDKSYTGEGYAVDASVTESWEGGYNLRLTVRNTSEETIHNWGVLFETQDTVRDLYNAQILSSREGVYLLRNSVYNQDIPAGGSVSFGYTAYYTGAADVPGEYAVSSIEKAVESGDFTVSYLVSDAWESGAVVQVMIENTSERAIEDWILEFDSQMQIAEIWNADLVSYEAGHYILRNVSYAQNIPAGETAVAGMRLSAAPGTEGELLKNVTVRQIVPSGEGGSTPSHNQVSDNNISDNNISGNNVSDNNVSDNNVSGNELPEGDTNYLSTGGDGGKIYYKTSYESDVVTAPDGLPCIRNQFLLSADDTVGFAEVEAYLAQNGARIVGYIEATNDYQAEMIADTDMTDLQELTERIGMQAWVRHIGLNYLWLEEAEFHTTDPWGRTDDEIDEWDSSRPGGNNWGLELIDFEGALVNAGVISDNLSTAEDIRTDHLTTVKMGIYDSAFDVWHEDLEDSFAQTWLNYEEQKDLFADNQEYNNDQVTCNNALLTHGSHVAGIMCAGFNNGKGISGICVKNELYGVAASTPMGCLVVCRDEEIHNTVYSVACGFAALITNNVKVINYSMGVEKGISYAASCGEDERHRRAVTYFEKQSAYMEEVLQMLLDQGYDFLIVTCAGNGNGHQYYQCDYDNNYVGGYVTLQDYNDYKNVEGRQPQHCIKTEYFPNGKIEARYGSVFNYIPKGSSCYDHIICVGALTEGTWYSCQIADYSNRGNRVDVYAPGDHIYSCSITGQGKEIIMVPGWISVPGTENYEWKSGTSMAAPFVSGTAGLAYNIFPDLSATEVKAAIINNVRGEDMVLDAAAVIADIQNTDYSVCFHMVDEDGNNVKEAEVEVHGRSSYWCVVLGAAMSNYAVGDNVCCTGRTNAGGNIKLDLPPGYYYLMVDGQYCGTLEDFCVSNGDAVEKAVREVTVPDYRMDVTRDVILQFHSSTGGEYVNSNGFVCNAEVRFVRGWIDPADGGEIYMEDYVREDRQTESDEPPVAVYYTRESFGNIGATLYEGVYTLEVTVPGGSPQYYHLIVSDKYDFMFYRFEL